MMYWSSASSYDRSQYQIEQAYLDGNQRMVIISGIVAVTALTIDYDTGILYWANEYVIEAARTDGMQLYIREIMSIINAFYVYISLISAIDLLVLNQYNAYGRFIGNL